MTMNRGNFSKALEGVTHSYYGLGYKEYPLEYPQFVEVRPVDGAFIQGTGSTGFGLFVKRDPGAGISFDDASQTFTDTFTFDEWGLGFIITKTMWKDGVAEKVGMTKSKALGHSQRATMEYLNANPLNRAFNSSYTFGDGKELCATDHPKKSGGTWRNELATASDLDEIALQQADIDIAAWKTDRGLPYAVNARKLIVHKANDAKAFVLMNTKKRVGTGDNDVSYIATSGYLPDGYMVSHYVDDEDAWFIKTDCPDGLIYFEREKPDFSPSPENDFDTDNAKFKATFRGKPGCFDKHGIFGSPGI